MNHSLFDEEDEEEDDEDDEEDVSSDRGAKEGSKNTLLDSSLPILLFSPSFRRPLL